MERKLELKDIAGYLPYGLKAYLLKNDKLIHGYHIFGNSIMYDIGEFGETAYIMPILRPLSDLYKTTTHDGKAIIPIVELAKIAFPNKKFELERDKCPIACIRNDDGDIVSQFSYYEYFYFVEFSGYRTKPNMSINIKNQYKLFDYLNELKIDYRGLIDAGVAVSVYDLDNNPYK